MSVTRKSTAKEARWEPGQAERWAGYLCKKSSETSIQTEIPKRFQPDFESDYKKLAGEEAYSLLSAERRSGKYYFLQENKQGREYRVYFNHGFKENSYYEGFLLLPEVFKIRTGRNKKNIKSRRINYVNFVVKMFELGFYLGKYDCSRDFERIKSRISAEFSSSFDEGLNL